MKSFNDYFAIVQSSSITPPQIAMATSMTAFSRHQTEAPDGQLVWEIRSVNHRYLDVHLKLPEELRALETHCRDHIASKLSRGRIDASLKYDAKQQINHAININLSALKSLVNALGQVEKALPNSGTINPTEILRWPGILEQPTIDQDNLNQIALNSLEHAIKELTTARAREGEKLGALIIERITASRTIVAGLRTALPDIEEGIQIRWQRRLDQLDSELDPARMAQELALLLARNDVSEELDRLDTHFGEVERTVSGKKPSGRRLDFLMQELNREANTLGSKAADIRNTNASVELKVLIDQMREQVQNLE